MPTKTKTISKVVHDSGPVRADLHSGDCFAPAIPAGKGHTTEREERIVEAYRKGADLEALTRNYHTNPAVLFKLLGLNPADHAETYAKLIAEYNDLNARAMR